MSRRVVSLVLFALLLATGAGLVLGRGAAQPAPGEEIAGALRVVDADTFDLGGSRIRLFGVDAPEAGQTCLEPGGAEWACGAWATEAARDLWEGRPAACEVLDRDRYGRAVSRCEIAGQDLGAALVGRGMALAYLDYSRDYLPAQEAAEAARRGLWRGTFEAPWDWRAEAREEARAEAAACAIKGNVSGSGRVYHLPGSPSYAATRIDEARGERWFCSEAEARAAGWRAPRG